MTKVYQGLDPKQRMRCHRWQYLEPWNTCPAHLQEIECTVPVARSSLDRDSRKHQTNSPDILAQWPTQCLQSQRDKHHQKAWFYSLASRDTCRSCSMLLVTQKIHVPSAYSHNCLQQSTKATDKNCSLNGTSLQLAGNTVPRGCLVPDPMQHR